MRSLAIPHLSRKNFPNFLGHSFPSKYFWHGIWLLLASLFVAPATAEAQTQPAPAQPTQAQAPAASAKKTNVILIVADDLGFGDLSCYGHKKFRTPNLDGFAQQGLRFTQFQSCCPYCAPTRAAILTGRYPFRYQFTQNPCPYQDHGCNEITDSRGLPLSEVTLAEVFRQVGYRTACVGKWHLGHQPEFRPLRQGFDEYFGLLYSNDMHPVELIDGDRVAEYPVVQATLTKRLTDRAIQFVTAGGDRPFFLYLTHVMPHKPLAASEAFYQKSGNGLYGDVIAELDHEVGRLLKVLDDRGLAENTIVIFTSDNGPWYGGSSGGLRGMKSETWEGGLRLPLLVRWPGRIPAGQVRHEPGIVMDFFPTLLSATGVPYPAEVTLDGMDLLPHWQGKAQPAERNLFAFRGNDLCTLKMGRWKYHALRPAGAKSRVWAPEEKWVDPRRPDGVRLLAPYEQAHPSQFPGLLTGDEVKSEALFDLETDPGEQRNVAAQHPDILARMRERFSLMRDEFRKAMGQK